jgi:O-antigen/teichoic acid export membrane protein
VLKAFAALSVFARIVSQAFGFLLIGRTLGASELGQFSLLFAYVSLIGLVAEYGSSSPALREMSAAKDTSQSVAIFNEYAAFRFVLGTAVHVLGLFGLAILGFVDVVHFPVVALFALSVLLGSQADFTMLIYRVNQRFNLEATVALLTSLSHVGIIAIACAFSPTLLSIGIAYVASRLVAVTATVMVARMNDSIQLFSTSLIINALRNLPAGLRRHFPYAADGLITASFSQLDTLLVGHLLGLHSLGNYQIGAKVMQMSLALVSIANNFYLPALARAVGSAQFLLTLKRACLELTLVGALAGGGVLVVMPMVVEPLLGGTFSEVNALWPGIALAILIRCAAAGFGIALIALNLPVTRIIAQIAILLSFTGALVFLAPIFSLVAAAYSLVIALFIGLLIYVFALWRAVFS